MAKKGTIYTQYSRPKKKPEINSGELITDEVHIPISDLVRDFIKNGERLQAERAKYYHDRFGKDEMKDFVPPNVNADPVLMDNYIKAAADHLEKRQEAIEKARKKAEEDVRKSREAEAQRSARQEGKQDGDGGQDLPEGAGQK